MQATVSPVLPKYVRETLLFGVVIALALVLGGRLLVPTASFRSSLAALSVLFVYAGMANLFPARLHGRDPEVLRIGVIFGLLAAAVFVAEIILEYIWVPKDNSRYGAVEFGLVFLLYFISGFVSARRTRSVGNAVWTSMASAFIASLIWVITVLVMFYVFYGTPRQSLVLRAEGDYEDFARSGMTDFNAFIMEDFMGATFFHLSLGLLVAAILGGVGGLLGKASARLLRKGAEN